ncbi:MAG: hypothetical protein HRT43_05035 [Campylobacteraceae bacterium]|nr:hypothetical protein [Campylobacteraceae bacterium]
MKLITVSILLLFSINAYACSCNLVSTEELINDATEIVYVQTTSSSLKKGDKRDKVEVNYNVIERFKGEKNNEGTVYEYLGSCSLGISTGRPYIFFMEKNRVVSRCNGSRQSSWNDKLLLELRSRFQ